MLLPRPRAVEISAARAAGPALADQLAALGSHGPFGPPWAGLWCACNFSAYCMECKRIKEPPAICRTGYGVRARGEGGMGQGVNTKATRWAFWGEGEAARGRTRPLQTAEMYKTP